MKNYHIAALTYNRIIHEKLRRLRGKYEKNIIEYDCGLTGH